MASTAIPAVRAAVLETLTGSETLEGFPKLKISAGKEPERAPEWIWVWKAQADREFKVLGPQPAPVEEDVKVWLRIVAIHQTEAESRAAEILEAAETALRSASLGGSTWNQLLQIDEAGPVQFDQKLGYHFVTTLSVHARI